MSVIQCRFILVYFSLVDFFDFCWLFLFLLFFLFIYLLVNAMHLFLHFEIFVRWIFIAVDLHISYMPFLGRDWCTSRLKKKS